MAGGFGGGMGGQGGTCGAVTGSIMVLGLKYGKTKAEDNAAKEKTYRLVREFTQRFEERHQALLCRNLIDADLSTPEGLKAAQERKVFETKCSLFVRDAVKILEELLTQ
jgi:C_GCAxxG_C_C family probable redox protein